MRNTTSNDPVAGPQVIDEGKTLALTVLVTKLNTTQSIKYRWYYKSSAPAFPSLTGNESTLQLRNLKAENTGIYFCVVSVAQSIIKTEEIKVSVNCKMKHIKFLFTAGHFFRITRRKHSQGTKYTNFNYYQQQWFNLTHCSPVLLFYTLWKHNKTFRLFFYTLWKHQKTFRFSDVFRGDRKATAGCNGLILKT